MSFIKAWLLNTIYLSTYALMAPVIVYRRIFKGRPLGHFSQRFLGATPRLNPRQHNVWLHAVSVGEVNLLGTLLDRLRRLHPDSRFVISTTTATGMKLAREKYPEIESFYFPIDFSWAMRHALKRLAPDLIILTELEVWPNLVDIAFQKQVPVVVVNGRLSENSFSGYLKLRRWLKPTFSRLTAVVAQTDDYAQRFIRLGCDLQDVHVAGSVKFDGALIEPDRDLLSRLADSIALQPDDVLLVAGSTQDPEEAMTAGIWSELVLKFPALRLVIVPRHPHRGPTIHEQLESAGIDSVLRSQNFETSVDRNQVLIADTIGELSGWWSLASIAFVGGSFGNRGGQNMIEPAACGTTVCFGPNTRNFKQIVELMTNHRVATIVNTPVELNRFVERCLIDRPWARHQADAAARLVKTQVGAADRTCRILENWFDDASENCGDYDSDRAREAA